MLDLPHDAAPRRVRFERLDHEAKAIKRPEIVGVLERHQGASDRIDAILRGQKVLKSWRIATAVAAMPPFAWFVSTL